MNVESTSANSVLEQYQRTQETQTAGSQELGRDEFMTLFVAQLENQNPLEPQDNGEFISQLAQFSSLEQLESLNVTATDMSQNFQSNRALEASMLVGREVQVRTDTAWLTEGKPFSGVIELPASSSSVSVSIYGEDGTLVRKSDLGARTGGEVELLWDGKDNSGNQLPSGNYRVKAEAVIDGENEQLNTLLGANVNSVTLGDASTGTLLNLAGVGKVPLSEVRTIQ